MVGKRPEVLRGFIYEREAHSHVKSFGRATDYIAQTARGQFTLQPDCASWIHDSKQKMGGFTAILARQCNSETNLN